MLPVNINRPSIDDVVVQIKRLMEIAEETTQRFDFEVVVGFRAIGRRGKRKKICGHVVEIHSAFSETAVRNTVEHVYSKLGELTETGIEMTVHPSRVEYAELIWNLKF